MGNTEKKDIRNILFVSSFGWLRGGGQISLWNLLSRLDKSKFRPVLICPEAGVLTSSSQEIGIPTEIIGLSPFRLWNSIAISRSLSQIAKSVKKYQIDIVHCDDLRQIFYFGILKPFLRIRLIWHIRVSWRNIISDLLGFFLSDKIICTAKIIANKFKCLPNFRKKVHTIYNAIDYDYFKPTTVSFEEKEKYNIGAQDLIIGSISRLHPMKGVHFLIDAFPDIRQSLKNIKLIIVGDGSREYKQSLEERIEELGIGGFVIFTGFKQDVRPILNILDLFILPTLEEGFSRSILEAMASGLPVLTTDTGGNSELVENGITGIIIPKPNPMIIAQEVIRLLSQKELLVLMGTEARKRVIENFSIAENVRLTEEVYSNLY